MHILKGHEDKIYVVAFDGKKILTGDLDGARVWDPVAGYASSLFCVIGDKLKYR